MEINSQTDLSLEFLMGRALDNAMLNIGLKDIAKGKSNQVLGSITDMRKMALRILDSGLKILYLRNMTLLLEMEVLGDWLHASLIVWLL
jgi:hypothetical protein